MADPVSCKLFIDGALVRLACAEDARETSLFIAKEFEQTIKAALLENPGFLSAVEIFSVLAVTSAYAEERLHG